MGNEAGVRTFGEFYTEENRALGPLGMSAPEVLRRYVETVEHGPSEEHDGMLRYRARLHVLRDGMILKPLEGRVGAYIWLLGEKYSAADKGQYERAEALQECQNALDDVINPLAPGIEQLQQSEIYNALEEFLVKKKWFEGGKVRTLYERALLETVKVNGHCKPYELLLDPQRFIAVVIGIMRKIDKRVVVEFWEHYKAMDEATKARHRAGFRG